MDYLDKTRAKAKIMSTGNNSNNSSQNLQRQQESFRRALKNQPVIQRKHLIASAAFSSTATSSTFSSPHSPSSTASSPVDASAIEALRPDITESRGQRHLYSYVHSVISLLKLMNKPMSVEEIKEKINVDLNNFKELLECIMANDKILYSSGKFSYKPVYNARTREDLLELLRVNRDSGQGGVEMAELKESWAGTVDLAKQLHKEKDILVLKSAKDDSFTLLYYNDFKYPFDVDQQFKDAWHGLKLPDDHDVQMELDRAGLKTADVINAAAGANGRLVEPKKKASKKFNRRIKITNTHLGIDITKDIGQ